MKKPYKLIRVDICDGFPSATTREVVVSTHGSAASAERKRAEILRVRPDLMLDISGPGGRRGHYSMVPGQ